MDPRGDAIGVRQRVLPSVDVVVVNWNTGPCLGNCLRSIVRTDRSRLRVARIVVVDNASTDDSLRGLSAGGIPLDIVRNATNRGFAVACNQGAARGTSELLLFLNPDTELYPDTLRVVAAFLGTSAARATGICGGRMLDERGRTVISCSRFPTLRVVLGKITGLDRLVPALFPPHHLDPTGSGPVDQVIGAFFLLRRTLFERLDGFDQRYFLYFEETDLALRADLLGLGSYHLHEARVRHLEGVSSARLGGGRLRHSLCSRTQYAYRHWPRTHAWLLVALTLTVEPVARLARALVRASPAEARATLLGVGGYAHWLCAHTLHVLERRLLRALAPDPPTASTKDHRHAHHRPLPAPPHPVHAAPARDESRTARPGAAGPRRRLRADSAAPADPLAADPGPAGPGDQRQTGAVPATAHRRRGR